MSIKKIFGLIFTILGLIIVFSSIYSTYLNFTGQSDFPQIFEAQEVKKEPKSTTAIEDQMANMIREFIGDMIPQGAIFQMFNMMAWMLFAFFLIYSGSKLVFIGLNFLENPKKEE